MPSIELEFEVFCACGNPINYKWVDGKLLPVCENTDSRESRNKRMNQLVIQPCKKCLENRGVQEYDDGWKDGYSEGFNDGKEEVKNA